MQEGGEGRVLEIARQPVADGDIAPLADPHVLTDKLADTGTEDGQGKARDILVGPEGGGQKAEDQRRQGPGQEGAQDGDGHCGKAVGPAALLIVEHAAQAHGPAHEHDALPAQVEVAGLLREHLAQRAEEQGRAVGNGSGHQGDQQGYKAGHYFDTSLWPPLRRISR